MHLDSGNWSGQADWRIGVRVGRGVGISVKAIINLQTGQHQPTAELATNAESRGALFRPGEQLCWALPKLLTCPITGLDK